MARREDEDEGEGSLVPAIEDLLRRATEADDSWQLGLIACLDLIDEELYALPYQQVDKKWPRLMKRVTLTRVRARLGRGKVIESEAVEMIGWLDKVILTLSTSDQEILDLIKSLQEGIPRSGFEWGRKTRKREPDRIYPIERPIPAFTEPPDLEHFLKIHSPFIVKGYADDYDGIKKRPWADLDYLLAVAGPGRLVPVEIGERYTDEGWGQRLMSFGGFLETMLQPDRDRSKSVYLGQHDLFTQFPALQKDIHVPDYCHVDRGPTVDFPDYRPPTGDKDNPHLIINAWCGPPGVVSPLHHDPYYNCYIVMAGEKYIWIAPPELKTELLPYGADDGPLNRMLDNTSRLDPIEMMTASGKGRATYQDRIGPRALQAILQKGDLVSQRRFVLSTFTIDPSPALYASGMVALLSRN